MKKIITFIICSLFFLSSAQARDVVFYDLNEDILIGINEFRAAPLVYLDKFNIQRDDLSEDWLSLIENGMEPLKIDPFLTDMATSHIRYMFDKNHISHSCDEHKSLLSRARKFGYKGVFVGESIIVFCFENYVSSEDAKDIMLDSLFKDALLRSTQEGAPILFKPYQDIGIAFGAGKMSIQGTEYNAYIMCLDFGVSEPDGYFLGRVSEQGKIPLPENTIGDVKIIWWQGAVFFHNTTRVFADGSFFMPYDDNQPMWLYVIPEDDKWKSDILITKTSPINIYLDPNY